MAMVSVLLLQYCIGECLMSMISVKLQQQYRGDCPMAMVSVLVLQHCSVGISLWLW